MRLLLAITLLLASCATLPPAPPVPPLPPTGASCSTACDRGRALGCEWARATPNGVECEAVCESFEASGTLSYGIECVTNATGKTNAEACEAAESCGGPK